MAKSKIVKGVQKTLIEDKFADAFLTKEGETVEEAKIVELNFLIFVLTQ